jgi:serine/threonine protein kinase
MTPERWQRIEQLYQAALERAPSERMALLEEVCAGDETLLQEVAALLAAEQEAGDFLQGNALNLQAAALANEMQTVPAVPNFSHYQIVTRIGAGGMGGVWLARDTALDRQVALKLLPVACTADSDRLRRFVREAKAASALNHPNIITIYEIGQLQTGAGQTHYIATEFIQGVTLRARLAAEKPSLSETLKIALQIVAALAAAHEAGIVHRDIKPENVMIRPDGLVKVLDFGLAKLTERRAVEIDHNVSTMTMNMTAPGVVMGTARYMSPEQARGTDVDARSDIFSLGVVLYEMIAGRTPFNGVTMADLIAALLEREPEPLTKSAPDTPAELERIVAKALVKDRQRRYQTIKDLQLDLQTLKEDSDLSAQLQRSGRSSARVSAGWFKRDGQFKRWAAVGVAVLAVLLIAGALWKFAVPSATPPMRDLQFTTIFGKRGQGNVLLPQSRFSPNGKLIAFVATGEGSQIRVRQISSDTDRQVTFGKSEDDKPLWSPDGEQLAFVSNRGEQLGIWVIPSLGGTPTLLTTLGGSEAIIRRALLRLVAWPSEAAIYYEWQCQLFRLDLKTKAAASVFAAKEPCQEPREFALAADEREVAFAAEQNGQHDIWRARLPVGELQRVTNDSATDRRPRWLADGRLLYNSTRDGRLQIYMTDSANPPVLLPTGDHQCWLADYSAAGERLLCYEQRDESDVHAVQLTNGAERQITSDFGVEFLAHAAADGSALLYQAIPDERFLLDPRRSLLFTKQLSADAPVTKLASDAFEAQWSPDNQEIGFLRLDGLKTNLWKIKAVGGEPQLLTGQSILSGGYRNSPPFNRVQTTSWCWSPDSRRIAYCAQQDGVHNLWTVTADGAQTAQLSNNRDAALRFASPIWSAAGDRVAYLTMKANSGQETWSLWVTNQEPTAPIWQTTAILRLLGWATPDRLLVAQAENVVGSRALPTTVKLLSITMDGEQRELGVLVETYLSNVHLAPDGRGVAFVRAATGRDEVWFAALTGGQLSAPRQITNNNDSAFFLASLAWAPDGKTIYFDKQTRWSLLTMIERFR